MGMLASVDDRVSSYLVAIAESTSNDVLRTFKPVFIVGASIWLILACYQTAMGEGETISGLLHKIGKHLLLGTFALWGWPYVAGMALGLKALLVAAIGGGDSLPAVLDRHLFTPLVVINSKITLAIEGQIESLPTLSVLSLNIGDYIDVAGNWLVLRVIFLILCLCVGFLTVLSMAMFWAANAMFYFVLAVGPVFLFCAMFPLTQRFTESWTGSIVTACLAMGLVALITVFGAEVLGLRELATIDPELLVDALNGGDEPLVAMASTSIVALMLVFLYFKIFDLASALGGGVHMGGNLLRTVSSMVRMVNSRPSPPPRDKNKDLGGAIAPRSGLYRAAYGTGHALGVGSRYAGQAASAGARAAVTGSRYAYNRGVAAFHQYQASRASRARS